MARSLNLGSRGIVLSVQLICPFVFANAQNRFSHDAAHITADQSSEAGVVGAQGPVVQSIVSLTTSVRCQFVQYMLTTLSNPLLFFVRFVIFKFEF